MQCDAWDPGPWELSATGAEEGSWKSEGGFWLGLGLGCWTVERERERESFRAVSKMRCVAVLMGLGGRGGGGRLT